MKTRAALILMAALLLVCGCVKQVQVTPAATVAPTVDDPNASATHSMLPDIETENAEISQSGIYSRLGDGPLDELATSKDYGLLLPYAAVAVNGDYGGIWIQKYGLVTVGGVIVTDGIYDIVERAYTYSADRTEPKPAYLLVTYEPDSEDQQDPEKRCAACAIDGSWVTPFDYASIWFSENVIVLTRKFWTLDIDIYNYNGTFLYNMLDTKWAKGIAPGEKFNLRGYGTIGGRDYAHIRMGDGNIAFINLQTGECRETEFVDAGDIGNEGLVAVAIWNESGYRQLWGYINAKFEIAIPLQYEYALPFINGFAVVAQWMSSLYEELVIDANGDALLLAENGNILRNVDGTGFKVFDYDKGTSEFYTNEFARIMPQSKYGERVGGYSIEGGWYVGDCYEKSRRNIGGEASGAMSDDRYIGKLLFSETEEYLYQGVSNISQVIGNYVIYATADADQESSQGVMTLDGRDIIPLEKNVYITAATDGDSATAFMVNSIYYVYGMYDKSDTTFPPFYKLIRTDGTVLASGSGALSYNDTADMYAVITQKTYSYVDRNGDVKIRIPLEFIG